MPESFGARLRQRRERQEVALATIAEQTKIKQSLLEELERDDVSHWPGGIFRRAFIRAYARAIGLEPEAVVHEFLDLYPDPTEELTPPAADIASVRKAPHTRFRYLVGSAIGSLSCLGRRIVQGDGSAAEPCGDLESSSARSRRPAIERAAERQIQRTAPIEENATAVCVPTNVPAPSALDPMAAAQLCAEFSRVEEIHEVAPLLQEAAKVFDAVGLIFWVWDPEAAELKPALTQGYSAKTLGRLPRVGREADNATAAAFRSARTCVVTGSDSASGALAVPVVTPAGCVGVLAIELQHGSEQREPVRALATFIAAEFVRLAGAVEPAMAADRRLA